jgi:hypothetical protein
MVKKPIAELPEANPYIPSDRLIALINNKNHPIVNDADKIGVN